MVSYKCPLCCNATFSTLNALKIHLVNAAERLCCPLCKNRQSGIKELIVHLDKNACKTTLPQPPPPPLSTVTANVKVESVVEKNDSSILEKALLASSVLSQPITEVKHQSDNDETVIEGDDSEGTYTCQMCDVTFDSIEEHLRKFHEGEEVLVETDNPDDIEKSFNVQPDDDVTNQNNDSLSNNLTEKPLSSKVTKFDLDDDEGGHDNVDNNDDDVFDEDYEMEEEEEEEDDDIDDIDEEEGEIRGKLKLTKQRVKNMGRQQTIEEKECVDKEGRPYTRKVVKIDKFWKRVEEDAIIENFLYQDGKIKKLDDETLAQVDENAEILQVYNCKKCKLSYGEENAFLKHDCITKNQVIPPQPTLTKSKKPLNRYKCRYCTVTCATINELQNHTASHVKKDQTADNKTITLGPYVCHVCQTKFASFKSLRLHSRMHDTRADRAVTTVALEIEGGTSVDINGIPVTLVQADTLNHVCTTCNRHFDTKENLEMHSKAHRNEKKHECNYCKKQFLSYKLFREHVDTICRKRAYECQYCGRRFGRPHEKVKHERIHTGEKPHVCEVCGKAFRVSYCLTLHMRTHSGTRPYQCTVCGKRFKSHSVYNHHQLTHSDVRAYKCPYCPKAFKTSVQLAGHKNSHTKPFSCTECNRPFASLYAVRAHMETHKRENNLKYDCWLCGASYARSFALRDHMKSQHEQTIVDLEADTEEGMIVALPIDEGEEPTDTTGQLGEAISSIVGEDGSVGEVNIEQELVGVEDMEVVQQQEITV